jgi:hypothetical protein
MLKINRDTAANVSSTEQRGANKKNDIYGVFDGPGVRIDLLLGEVSNGPFNKSKSAIANISLKIEELHYSTNFFYFKSKNRFFLPLSRSNFRFFNVFNENFKFRLDFYFCLSYKFVKKFLI